MTIIIPLYVSILLGILILITVPIYVTLLCTIVKFRHKVPFNSAFFKMTLHLGIFDLIHLANDWILGMLPHIGLYHLITTNPNIFGRIGSMLWWSMGLSQIVGVLFLALDRFLGIWYNYVSQNQVVENKKQ